MNELINALSPFADTAIALATVIIVQIIKIYLPNDPEAEIGKQRFTVAPRFKKHILAGTFLIAITLSMLLDPHKDQDLLGRLRDGLITASMAVVMWEAYSNWLRPIFEGAKK